MNHMNQTPPNHVPFSATCKFCGVHLNCQVDPAGVAEKPTKSAVVFSAEILRKIACCNRCSDARTTEWVAQNKLRKFSAMLQTARYQGKEATVIAEVREGFTRAAKWWVNWLCELYRIEDQWDAEIIETLVAKPERYTDVARMLRGMVERAARKVWVQ